MKPMRTAECVMLAALLSVGCAFACGQVSSAAQNPPQPLVRSEAATVLVDVVATKKGHAVLGLSRKQFHLFEEGREQAIGYFEEHKALAASPVVQRRALPPHTYNNLPSEPPGSAVNVLLLDALNTPMGNQVEVRKQMVKYLETIRPGTTMAIFTLSSKLRMVQGFTSNAGDLMAALKNASANPKQSTSLDAPNGSAFDSAISNLSMMQGAGPAVAAMEAFQSANDSFQADMRAGLTLEALQQLARYLSNVPGRKNLIWFSGSFPINIAPTDISNPAAGSRSYINAIRSTDEMLAAARVAVYPVSAEGLATLASLDMANNGLSKGPQDPPLTNRFTMETIASQTGGLATFNYNDFAQAVANAVDNGSSYYTIGYVPADRNFHGQFRKLKVHVDDCGCELEYRSGYYADPPDKASQTGLPPADALAARAVHGAPPSTQILFEVRVLPESDPLMKDVHLPAKPIGAMAQKMKKPYTRYIMDMGVDPRTLVFETGNDGTRKVSIEFALIGYDAEGKRVNYVERTANLSLNASQYEGIMKSGFPVRLAMEMPAGQDFLVVAIHDLDSARVGSLEIPLSVAGK